MGWIYVILAALFEIVGVVGLNKFTHHKNVINTIIFFGGFLSAFVFLYASFNYLPVSIAYAVWVGIGTSSAVLINMIFFNESRNIGRIISLVIIIVGVTGLKAVS
ncbi:MAG TPA: multidrug efflux SMR transporter [Aliicoccus persicus]|uniref:Multidrug efflux SMR transporter n=1 Tax=Aliicoccus persicus TaxID=930138 RepID=A0A921DXH4_9STAP|nr:multidrug efflux SMR transporter [Aliicoccus persicus]